MPRLKRLNAKQVLRILLTMGFYEHHQKGSHIHLRHEKKAYLRVVVPFHTKVLAPKTIKSIISQTELDHDSSKAFYD